MIGKSFGGAFFLMLLMCFTLALSPSLAIIEIDNSTIFSTEDMNYSFASGYNLTGTLTLTSSRLDIDNYYVFNISATGGDCNISIIRTTPTTLEWNSSCQAGVTKLDNFLGNYTKNQRLYLNGTYNSLKTPSNYFVYFAYLNPTEDNFILNLTNGIKINIVWVNGAPVMNSNIFATNGTDSLTMTNSSPVVYEEADYLGGFSNFSASAMYSYSDSDGNHQGIAYNTTTINNTGSSFIEKTLTLYIPGGDIMGVEFFWIFLFLIDAAFIFFAYTTKDYPKGLISSILGILLSAVIAIYSGGLTMLDAGTITLMMWLGIGMCFTSLMIMFANVSGLFSKL
jgi:hypothetical protein